MKENQEFTTKFTFHLIYFDGSTAQEMSMLNFFATPKEFGNPDLAVENSVEIVHTFQNITGLFHDYMRGITEDYLYKNYENGFSPSTKQNPNSKYIFKLVDHSASVRNQGKLTDEKEVRVIYQQEIYANDFYAVPQLSILPIWKDNGNSKGIRSMLKDLLSLNHYTNRFKTPFEGVKNTFTVNSYQL
jgi:hypothetical protein